MLMTLPLILRNIVQSLQQYRIAISEAVEGEGRGGSLKDEGTVKRFLNNEFPGHIIDEKARKFGDMIVLDYDKVTKHVVNIKTSEMSSSDNCFSKGGIVYALTNIECTDSRLGPMNLCKMVELIHTHGHHDPMKDYWFLCIDKKDSANVLCRGAKQIQNWKININPSNILQVDWKAEKNCDPVERDWNSAYNVLVNGAKNSTFAFINNLPTQWKEEIRLMFH